ncbi:MAG: pitrilysin family protein [Candidatus Calescibacterium sp.]|nr:insulinase family protein [Candidatus Calescibacterium sp.]MDW8133130.1 pitrilysin family protein [Candidatus Calescibacterium sp.]
MNRKKVIQEFIDLQERDTFILDFPFKVIYKKVNNPISFVALFTKVGSIYEKDEYKGIAHLIEHCIFRGSEKYPENISKIINSMGGYTNAYTSYDQTAYYINLPSTGLYEAIDILWDMVFNPLFRESDVESEKNIIYHEIEMRDDEPMVVLFEETLKKMYISNPIRNPIIGYKETLQNIDKKSITEFYSYYKNPHNSFFVVVTDEDRKKVEKNLAKLFKNVDINNKSLVSTYDTGDYIKTGELKLKGNVSKTYLMISYRAPTLMEKNGDIEKSYYFSLMSYILAGSSYSVFNRILKNEMKLVDAVSFDIYSTNELPGIIYFSAIAESKNIQKIIDEYSKIIRNLKSFIEVEYFNIVKENFYSSAFWNFETSSNQGMLIGSNELFKTYKEAYNYLYKIENIQLSDLYDIFYEYVDPDNFVVSIYEKG